MKKRITVFYTLIILIAVQQGSAAELKPVYKQPMDDFVANIKASGQKRIAQGVDVFVGKDPETREVFSGRAPVMLTENPDSGEWTISVLHSKIEGGVVLLGTHLVETTSNMPRLLNSFNSKVAEAVMLKIESYDPTYYPDEIPRLVNERDFRRVYTGDITLTTHPKFQNAPDLKFIDILKSDKDDRFIILMVDINGVCYKILSGPGFGKNS